MQIYAFFEALVELLLRSPFLVVHRKHRVQGKLHPLVVLHMRQLLLDKLQSHHMLHFEGTYQLLGMLPSRRKLRSCRKPRFEDTCRLGVVSCLLVPYRPAFRAVRQAPRVVRVGMPQAWRLVLLGVGAWQLVLRGERACPVAWQPVWRLGGYRLALDELLDRRPRREACRAAAGRETSERLRPSR